MKSDFALWTAAIYANNATLRDVFIRGAKDFLAFGATGQAFPDLYNSVNASSTGFVDRPVIGGVYALLAQAKLASDGTASSNGIAVAAAASATMSPDIAVVSSVAPLFTAVTIATPAATSSQGDTGAASLLPLQATASSAAHRRLRPFWRW